MGSFTSSSRPARRETFERTASAEAREEGVNARADDQEQQESEDRESQEAKHEASGSRRGRPLPALRLDAHRAQEVSVELRHLVAQIALLVEVIVDRRSGFRSRSPSRGSSAAPSTPSSAPLPWALASARRMSRGSKPLRTSSSSASRTAARAIERGLDGLDQLRHKVAHDVTLVHQGSAVQDSGRSGRCQTCERRRIASSRRWKRRRNGSSASSCVITYSAPVRTAASVCAATSSGASVRPISVIALAS